MRKKTTKKELIAKVRQQIAEAKEALNNKPSGKKITRQEYEEAENRVNSYPPYDPMAHHFNEWFDGRQKAIKGGKNSKRKPDPLLMQSAKDAIKCFREKFNNHCDLKDTHSVKSLYKHMVNCGFTGTESWVKKHFDTITKVSVP